MKIQIILVPYDSGHKNVRMGQGPESFIDNGLTDALKTDGHVVDVERIDLGKTFPAEIGTAFELNRILSRRVRAAVEEKKFPVVLAGNCNSSIGTLAGVGQNELGLVWFDGHGDFNTPETTISGFLDGMALAIATGRCWRQITASIPDFHPVVERDAILVGARDLDLEEKKLLDGSGIALVSCDFIRHTNIVEAFRAVLGALEPRVKRVHLHLDLDVLDPEQTPANHMAPPDGLFVGETELAIRMIRGRFGISSVCIAAYDPDFDRSHNTVQAGIKLLRVLLRET